MKILLACSAGMSTSLLEKNIVDYGTKNNLAIEAKAYASEQAKGLIDNFDVVLLGPQVRFLLPSFQKLCDAKNKPVGIIPPRDYAFADGEKIVKFAQELLDNK